MSVKAYIFTILFLVPCTIVYYMQIKFKHYSNTQLAHPNCCRKSSISLVTIMTCKSQIFCKIYPTGEWAIEGCNRVIAMIHVNNYKFSYVYF